MTGHFALGLFSSILSMTVPVYKNCFNRLMNVRLNRTVQAENEQTGTWNITVWAENNPPKLGAYYGLREGCTENTA